MGDIKTFFPKIMKKLLILNTDPMDYSYGGVCPFMRNMHPYLTEAFEVEYMVLPESWKRIAGSTRIKYLAYLWLHRALLKRYDFILAHGPEGGYMASLSGVPYSYVYHGNSNPMSISRFRIGKYFARMYDRMFARIDATCPLVYTVGPARNGKQRKLYNPLKQDVMPLPIEKRRGFIFAGRLEAMKNVDRLIRIYGMLPEEVRRDNPFYIAGFGTQEESLRLEVRELGLENQVIFLGKVDNTKMLETDADKRILLMASSTEGMPTAIAEAFSVGVPVVSTAVGDIPSVVKSPSSNFSPEGEGEYNGRLFPLDFKDEEYVAAIMDILNDYERYARAAYSQARLFNREVITKGVIMNIKGLICE